MRVAVLFFGRLKHHERKYLLNSLPKTHEYDIFLSCDAEPQELLDNFIGLYSPIAATNEKIAYDVDFGKYPNQKTHPVNIHNMTCHFLNKKRVFGLLEQHVAATGAVYDVVLSARLDLSVGPLGLQVPAENTVYIPSNEDHTGINDRLAFGDMETMKKYMNVFDNCLYLLENNLSVPHPENLTLYNILHWKISVSRFHLDASLVR